MEVGKECLIPWVEKEMAIPNLVGVMNPDGMVDS